jgi:hypothetical protein
LSTIFTPNGNQVMSRTCVRPKRPSSK